MAFRAQGTYGSDERTRGNGKSNTIFLHFPDAATDEEVTAQFQKFVPVMNAKLVSVNKQIDTFGYNDLPEGLPGKLVKVLFKNQTTGATEQVSWVFGAMGIEDDDIAALFTATGDEPVLQNRYGSDLGDVIRVTQGPLSEE